MRRVALVTTSRSDWGIQRAIAERLRDRPDVELSIIAGGMHLSHEFGHTVGDIRTDGFEPAAELNYLAPGDTPADIAKSVGQGVTAFAEQYSNSPPDLVSVLGDRFDMLPAVIAATPFNLPVAHIHGGELTEGAFDDNIRHAITKMSHIHLVSTDEYARRVIQMGEAPQHVHCVGAPGLDDIATHKPLDKRELEKTYGFVDGQINILVVYHPETHGSIEPSVAMGELLGAIERIEIDRANIVIVSPNADTGHRGIEQALRTFCRQHSGARSLASIPRAAFLSLMRMASVMIGSSSSGIIEAPSFKTPVVNIGNRQAGRMQAANVINTVPMSHAIDRAIRQALSLDFVRSLRGLKNPYGDGQSAARIAELLATTPLTSQLLAKRFVDQPRSVSVNSAYYVSAPQSCASSINTCTAASISSRHAHSLGE